MLMKLNGAKSELQKAHVNMNKDKYKGLVSAKDKLNDGIVNGVRQKTLHNLLNFRPNPYQSIQEFRQAIFTDLILEGNVFIHFDGTFMYHLPSITSPMILSLIVV